MSHITSTDSLQIALKRLSPILHQPQDIVCFDMERRLGLTSTGWFTVLLPTIGPIMSGARKAPSFDDVEKMLQLFGIVSALILSVVADAASYDYEFPSDKTMQGRAFTDWSLPRLTSPRSRDVHLPRHYSGPGARDKDAEEQMKKWWQFGKFNLFLQVFFIVYTLVEYITYVNITHFDGYNDDNFELFCVIHIEYAFVGVLVAVHLFPPVMLYNDSIRDRASQAEKSARGSAILSSSTL